MTPHRLSKGFTLIELLIVVAIIAILAAIAVPNFLEAQVRSKVSRVHSDCRTLATAFEAYAVDFNVHPYGPKEMQDKVGTFGLNPAIQEELVRFRLACYSRITTPVSYITSLPTDPFAVTGMLDSYGKAMYGHNFYLYQSIYHGGGMQVAHSKGYRYMIGSFGPSRRYRNFDNAAGGPGLSNLTNDSVHGIYDPSNGTVSWGHIYRTNKGIFPTF